MADLALVFGWTPGDMADFSIAALMAWRERARVRYEKKEDNK